MNKLFDLSFLKPYFQRHAGKRLVQSKIAFSKQPVKIYHDKTSTARKPAQRTQEMSVQASPQQSEAEVQTEFSAFLKSRDSGVDAHNDSGVGTGDIDQEAYDLMVKGMLELLN